MDGSGSGSFMKFKMETGAAVSSEGLVEAGGSASKLTHSHAWKVILTTWIPWDCLSALTSWQLASPEASDLRKQSGSPSVFYDL